MEEVTLILQWDDVIGDIISFIMEKLGQKDGEVLEKIVFQPLRKMLHVSLEELYKQLYLENAIEFLTTKIEGLLTYLYIFCVIWIGISILKRLCLHLIYRTTTGTDESIFAGVLKKFIVLQVLHFVVRPLLLQVIDEFPHLLQWVNKFIGATYNDTIIVKELPKEFLMLEVSLLLLIVCLLLWLQFQWIGYRIKILVLFVKSYVDTVIDKDEKFSDTTERLKEVYLKLLLCYCCQQFLFLEILSQIQEIDSYSNLLVFASILVGICCVPLFLKGEK